VVPRLAGGGIAEVLAAINEAPLLDLAYYIARFR